MIVMEMIKSLAFRIQNLQARIDSCEDEEITYPDRQELVELLDQFEMKDSQNIPKKEVEHEDIGQLRV